MKKILLFALFMFFSFSAFGQITGCVVSSQPCTKAKVSFTGQTATVGSTTIFTALTTGTYRLSGTAWVTTAGSAGTVNVTISTNNGAGGANNTANLVNALSMTTLGAMTGSSVIYHVGAGQNINYLTTVTGATGSPVYGFEVVVEQLQ